jgi:hypothetical protein
MKESDERGSRVGSLGQQVPGTKSMRREDENGNEP